MQHGSNLYYIAIVAAPPVAYEIQGFKEEMKQHFGCKAAMKSPAHITLIPPFFFSKGLSKILMDTFMIFSANTGPIFIRVNGFGHFRRDVIFVQPEEHPALMQLQQECANYFVGLLGDKINTKRAFHPHITIANRDLKTEDFDEAWKRFNGRKYASSWWATDICLMRHNGSLWEITARRAL
jgi:2'-5' RNA ligase